MICFTVNCFGFVDGTARAFCKPEVDQEDYYSGHKRQHRIKFQSILLPNGIIANVWGPAEGRRHDWYMVAESEIQQPIRDLNAGFSTNFCTYGDKGYMQSDFIMAPFKGNVSSAEKQMNDDMVMARMSVEYGFLKVGQYFARGNYKNSQMLTWQQSAKSYIVSLILTYCYAALCGFTLAENLFSRTPEELLALKPPTLEEYLGVV